MRRDGTHREERDSPDERRVTHDLRSALRPFLTTAAVPARNLESRGSARGGRRVLGATSKWPGEEAPYAPHERRILLSSWLLPRGKSNSHSLTFNHPPVDIKGRRASILVSVSIDDHQVHAERNAILAAPVLVGRTPGRFLYQASPAHSVQELVAGRTDRNRPAAAPFPH